MLLVRAEDDLRVGVGGEGDAVAHERGPQVVAIVDATVQRREDGAAVVGKRLPFIRRFGRGAQQRVADGNRPATPVANPIRTAMRGRHQHPPEHGPIRGATVEMINAG